MDLPQSVLIHNELLGLKGAHGTLYQISDQGFYVVATKFGEQSHRVLLPIESSVIIFEEPEELYTEERVEIER